MIERVLLLLVQANIEERMKACHYLIEPPKMSMVRALDHKKADEIFNIGYTYASDKLPEIRILIGK